MRRRIGFVLRGGGNATASLAVERTGRGDLTLPLLSASLMAMLITMPLDSEPIYETRKHRMLEPQAKGERAIAARRAGIELSH